MLQRSSNRSWVKITDLLKFTYLDQHVEKNQSRVHFDLLRTRTHTHTLVESDVSPFNIFVYTYSLSRNQIFVILKCYLGAIIPTMLSLILPPVSFHSRCFHLQRSRQDRCRCELRPPSAHTLPDRQEITQQLRIMGRISNPLRSQLWAQT